jgi:hypothetical protein
VIQRETIAASEKRGDVLPLLACTDAECRRDDQALSVRQRTETGHNQLASGGRVARASNPIANRTLEGSTGYGDFCGCDRPGLEAWSCECYCGSGSEDPAQV